MKLTLVLAAVTLCAVMASVHTDAAPLATDVVPLANGSNALLNPQLVVAQNNVPAEWNAFEGGFQFSLGAGYKGHNAVAMVRVASDPARGISQNVVLDQQKAADITVSAWSRAENVSGVADNNYAVYCDLTYADGSNGWGFFAPFATGTSEWKQAQLVIKPTKAVRSLTYYALFREHTGRVWFSDFRVSGEGVPVASATLPVVTATLVPVVGRKAFAFRPFVATIPEAGAAFRVEALHEENALLDPALEGAGAAQTGGAQSDVPKAGWQGWGDGFQLRAGEGREGRRAAFVERGAADGERGIWQELALNQKVARPIALSGWSRSENVAGSPDSDYSIYADVTYQDGTVLFAENAPFATGTHGWQRARLLLLPEKPIKLLRFYALFRGHTGRAWFSDLRAGGVEAPPGAAFFDGLAVTALPTARLPLASRTITYSTRDGLSLGMNGGQVTAVSVNDRDVTSRAPGGFLVRDVANASDYFPLAQGRSDKLKLQLDTHITAAKDHLTVEGRVVDLSGRDRAISLVFALPIDARGWSWGQTMRNAKQVGADELSNTVGFYAGSNGRHSLYPVANIHDAKDGLALAIDPDFAAQTRLAVNGATRQFTVAFDFGLTPEKSAASFRFVLYRTDPAWGFRDALARMSAIFPAAYSARGEAKTQGLWMPFTDVRQVQGWQDFGFRFHEAGDNIATDDSLKWDDAHGILTFRYHEPMTWWMPMPAAVPRTYDNALAQLRQSASDPKSPSFEPARAVLASGFRDATGSYAVAFRDAPWAKGAVWSINPDPNVPGASTGATLGWSAAKRDAGYNHNPKGDLDGEYLDSLEGYVTSNLNFDRNAFKFARSPLTFDSLTFQPAQHKALLVNDYTRWESRDVHALGKLMFANSVPYRFTFLTPWLDVMGTETNWLPEGKWAPDADEVMSLRRAMSGTKPYLLLQNTDFDRFTSAYVEKYMQRALFYGMFPGFFSADAATKPYWLNPVWYNRDRPLFKKYLPLIRPVAQAGWQAVTLAVSDNPAIWVERFGTPDGPTYLTVRNDANTPQTARITLQAPLVAPAALSDLVSGQPVAVAKGAIELTLQADQCAVLKLR